MTQLWDQSRTPASTEPTCVLWCVPDGETLRAILEADAAIRLRTCLDAVDLAAAAMIEPRSIAVVSAQAPLVNADLVMRVESLGTQFLALGIHPPGSAERESERAVTRAWGIMRTAEVHDVPALLGSLAPVQVGHEHREAVTHPDSPSPVTLVWGATGAPGRSMVARGIAEALANRHIRTGLLDLDPHASQAISLGITNGDDGVMRAVRLVQRRALTPSAMAHICRSIGGELSVLTGIEQEHDVHEMTPEILSEVLLVSRSVFDEVVVDAGDLVPGVVAHASRLIIVVRHSVVGLSRAAAQLPTVLDSAEPESVLVVVNGSSSDRDSRLVLERLFHARGRRVDAWHCVPWDQVLTRAEERGKLLREASRRSRARKVFDQIVRGESFVPKNSDPVSARVWGAANARLLRSRSRKRD